LKKATALNAIITSQGELERREDGFKTTRGTVSTFFLSRNWRYRLAQLSIHLTKQIDALTLWPHGRSRCDSSLAVC